MDSVLLIFAVVFIIVMLWLTLVPYLKGRRDLATFYNLFLLGSLVFVGLSAINTATGMRHFMNYDQATYLWFMAGVAVFYTTFLLAYHTLKFPRRWAGRWLRKWPGVSPSVLAFILPLCLLFSLAKISPVPIPGLAQASAIIGGKTVAIGLVLAFIAWWQQRMNPILLALLVGYVIFGLLLAVYGGTGRRELISVLLAVPLAAYWIHFRYYRPRKTLTLALFAGLALTLLVGGYTNIRRSIGDHQSLTGVVELVTTIPSQVTQIDYTRLMGQNATEASLLSIHLYRVSDRLEPQPFHSLVYILVNPIPRRYWPDKPVGLGYSLPKDAGANTRATWGPGIVGHGFHEGGLMMLVFYGALAGAAMRFADELLVRQPSNPYILGILAGCSSQIFGWPRGDIGTFTLQIIAVVLAGLLIAWAGRLFFGTSQYYPRTDHLSSSNLPVSFGTT